MKSLPFKKMQCFATCIQGDRQHMEDNYTIAYQKRPCCHQNEAQESQSDASSNIDFYYFGVFDGHGGKAASEFVRASLLQNIVDQPGFWTDDDQQVMDAIRKGFRDVHLDMHNQIAEWPRSTKDLPSTAGTTASVIFIKNGKYYTGHVGDSRIVLAEEHHETGHWIARKMTHDHKPELQEERSRIEKAGGTVMKKNGVDRVVWEKPVLKPLHTDSTFESDNSETSTEYRYSQPTNYPIDTCHIRTIMPLPFLAVARSLGDLWSYNSRTKEYIVSPDPDVDVIEIDSHDRAIILASDGLWNMVNSREAVRLVQELVDPNIDQDLFENFEISDEQDPSESLVHYASQQWKNRNFKADNTSAVVILLEPNTKESSPSHDDSNKSIDTKTPCLYCGCSAVPRDPSHYKSRSPPVIIADSSKYNKFSTHLSLDRFHNDDDIRVMSKFVTDRNADSRNEFFDPMKTDLVRRKVSSELPSSIEREHTVICEKKRDAQTQANMPATPHTNNLSYSMWSNDGFFSPQVASSRTSIVENSVCNSSVEKTQGKLVSATSSGNGIISEIQKVVQRVDTRHVPTLARKLVQEITDSSSSSCLDHDTNDYGERPFKMARYETRRRHAIECTNEENFNKFAPRTSKSRHSVPRNLSPRSKCSKSFVRVTRSRRTQELRLAESNLFAVASIMTNQTRLRPRRGRK